MIRFVKKSVIFILGMLELIHNENMVLGAMWFKDEDEQKEFISPFVERYNKLVKEFNEG